MRVHHLNCGSMPVPTCPLVCHVLLVETGAGLVLVDTGFGLQDVARPARLGPVRHLMRARLVPEETALRQVEALGFTRADVRHVVLTHFDLDHVGGLADFPDAQVHVTAAEARGAVHAPSARERVRYRAEQWAHGPRLVEHEPVGEAWLGFAAVRELDPGLPGIALVSLPGHTRGHAGVAVETADGWLLHAGDAFYHPAVLDGGHQPRVLAVQEELVAFDRRQLHANQARLAELRHRPEAGVTVVCAHDPAALAAAQRAAQG